MRCHACGNNLYTTETGWYCGTCGAMGWDIYQDEDDKILNENYNADRYRAVKSIRNENSGQTGDKI